MSARSFVTKLGVACATVLTALATVVIPQAFTPAEANAQGRCPAVVVVAARGSGQNNVGATWYSNQAQSASNGWEGETIRAFLQTSEARYRATHGGNSLMKDVYVLGLTPQNYPATFPEYYLPDVQVPSTIGQVLNLVVAYGAPVINTAVSAANQFMYSVQTGRTGTMNAINDYERSTGCRPGYVLAGFSQGAMVLAEHERELADRGQLAGVVYMGNPMTNRSDPFTVGVPGAGGILGNMPNNTVAARATDNRINYCLPLDGVCNSSIATLRASEGNGGNHGRYFLQHSTWDNQVADAFGRWVDQRRF